MQKEKIKLEELLGIFQVFQFLYHSELFIKTHYWVDRIFEDVEKEFKKLEVSRKKLLDKYGTLDEKGELKLSADKKQYEFEPEKRVEFEKEYADIGQEEIEINTHKFTPEQFGDLKITGPMRKVLKRFLDEKVPEMP